MTMHPETPQSIGGPAEPPGTAPAAVGRYGRRTVLGAGLLAAVGVAGMTAATAPRRARLGEPTGDEDITTALSGHLSGHQRVAIALLDEGSEPRVAGFGATATDEFEIGSLTKVVTGALLAEAISRGDVTLETTVAEVLGAQADGSAIADVGFAELATHSAGLPTAPLSASAGMLASSFLLHDPYRDWDAERLVADALAATPTTRGQHAYSNMSVALEGQLVSRIADVPYPELVTTELLDPLGMGSTSVPVLAGDVPDTARRGNSVTGLPAAAWTMNGYAPAGCIRSTLEDLALFLTATRDGDAPGAESAREVLVEIDEYSGIGINWFHSQLAEDSTAIWHNGMTGGYAAFAGWDPSSGRGLALFSDTARSLDELAVGVLTGEVAL